MSTTNNIGTAPERHWTEDHVTPGYVDHYDSSERSNWDDAASAYREVERNEERDRQLKQARPDIEFHIARHGNLEDAIDFDLKAGRGLRNPEHRHPTAVHLHRTFAGMPPAILPEKPPPDEEPDGRLDDMGRDAWERRAARAYRDVPREKAYQEKVKAAEAKIAELEAEYPNQPINVSLAQGAIAKQALEIKPETAFKLARWNGAPVDEQQAQEQHVTRQGEQWLSGIRAQVAQDEQSGALAVEQPYAEHMGVFLRHLAATGQHTDYSAAVNAAYQYAANQVQAQANMVQEVDAVAGHLDQQTKTKMAQVIKDPSFQPSDSVTNDLHRAFAVVADRDREEAAERQKHIAEMARQASRSIAGSGQSPSYANDTSGGSDDIEGEVRSVYRSLATNRV